MRIIHRYLGFFLAGIMAMYSVSGIVLVFRNTDFLKKETSYERTIETNMAAQALGKEIGIKNLKVTKTEGDVVYFKQGFYNKATGETKYSSKKLPLVLNKMTKIHKATTNSPLYYLNIFFGLSLLFFVVSAFFMFTIKTATFRKGLYFTLGGIVLTLIMLFV